MEAIQVDPALFELSSIHGDSTGTPDHDITIATQSAVGAMKVEDIDPKEGPPHWQQSPERTTSLLPPFGASQPSHLPTPQSPGDVTRYVVASAESPLSFDHLRTGPSHQFSSLRPPSRPASTHPPKTPQRVSSTSARKNRFQPLPSTPELDHGRDYVSPTRPSHSQIVTPSPEVLRTRRASVPHTPSDSETMLATPRAGKRSLSHPYTGPSVLAPAPIISPANSSHSTVYQSSPEFDHPVLQAGRSYRFSHSMAALVSEHNMRTTEHDKEDDYGLVDPFIARGDEGPLGGMPPRRYPSPPISRHRDHSIIHDDRSTTSRAGAIDNAGSGNSIVRAAVLPYDTSEDSSRESPVKTEVGEGDYEVSADALHSLQSMATSHAPPSPRTPPVGSGAGSLFETPLEDSAFRTPPRAVGGEIERIRQRQADREEARILESEKRRPEYLVRIKRARDSTDDEVAERERESALPGLGVTVSPVKGRRLKLYRPIPMVNDPASEGNHTPENGVVDGPKTPPPLPSSSAPQWQPTVPIMSLRAIDWRTPGRGRSSPAIWTEEDEIKKQKRLAAFAAPQASGSRRRLKPVEVPGQGRMVVDVTSEETREFAEAGVLEMPDSNSPDDVEPALANGHGAEWPDDEYPWSLQEQERDDLEEAERRRRLQWIERFLDRESESDEDDDELSAGPSTWNHAHASDTPSRPQRGPGKTVSLSAVPESRRSRSDGRVSFGAANADARNVLLSKKHVREVAERVRKRKVAEEEEGVVMCICQGADDGRPMVRCDECRTWYHLVCMDIEDESELGDEWFCWKCVPAASDPPPAPPSQPTFAPAMPDSPPRTGVGDLPLYQSSLQPSPMLDIRARQPVTPPVPLQRNSDSDHSPPRRARVPHPVGDPGDPVRGGPSTPFQPRSADSRLYSTPKFYDEYGVDDYTPFDPTSTPSRGLKFPNVVPITPRRPHNWTPVQAAQWATPSGVPWTPHFSSQAGSSSTRSLAYSLSTLEDSGGPLTSPWPSDESPVRRPHKPGEAAWPYAPSRRVLESPLAMRGAINRPYPSGVEDSPTTRVFSRTKDRDINDLTSRAGHGSSPRRE